MELTHEDGFRLNVLLASKPMAIRIDEGRMRVLGLSDRGESRVELHPNTRPDRYLRLVRELISGHVLGSPGGYPVYLRRWTRMGQMRDESLEQLLLLGEPEAVVAAVCAPGLTDELARRAWWAMEDAENARRMLYNQSVIRGGMGPILAQYLVDYLPFETESERIIESISLVLQPGLIDSEIRSDLWRKSARKQSYLVGFLRALPDDLPEPEPARVMDQRTDQGIERLAGQGNALAQALLRVLSVGGQTWLRTVGLVLTKPPNQDVVTTTFDCMRDYLAAVRPAGDPDLAVAALMEESRAFALRGAVSSPAAAEILGVLPGVAEDLVALRLLSGLGYGVLRPVLPDPTTQGSVMRRRLAPVMTPIQAAIARLRGRG